jgi:hypothetical protein
MQPPRKLRILAKTELRRLTVARLLAYRKKALSLEDSLAASDYHDHAEPLDEPFIWFKEDPRWQTVYDDVLAELARKQSESADE